MQRRSSGRDGRVEGRRKGGKLTGCELAAKLTDQGADGVVAITESLGDFLHRLIFEQDGTQRFVLAMKWIAGLLEKRTDECGIHAATPIVGYFCVATGENANVTNIGGSTPIRIGVQKTPGKAAKTGRWSGR